MLLHTLWAGTGWIWWSPDCKGRDLLHEKSPYISHPNHAWSHGNISLLKTQIFLAFHFFSFLSHNTLAFV